MRIFATLHNTPHDHRLSVSTEGVAKALALPAKASGRGSSINGGELLVAALATCFCNDVFREAGRRGLSVSTVQVDVEAEFPSEGAAASAIRYRVAVHGHGEVESLRDLVLKTDRVTEVQNTVRMAVPVILESVEAFSE